MGLGKTLTMLSAMISTADEAKEFANSSSHGMNLETEHSLIPSRATLVVVASPCKSEIPYSSGADLIEYSITQ